MSFTTHYWGIATSVGLTAVAIGAAAIGEKLTNALIGAAMVSCILVGLRLTLEGMLDRIANDSYDSGKAAERRAIVRDLAEYVERKNQAG